MDDQATVIGIGAGCVARVDRPAAGLATLRIEPLGNGSPVRIGPAPGASDAEYCAALGVVAEQLSLAWMDVRLMIATFGEDKTETREG